MKKTIIVNIWAGPGHGKSTLASGLFSELKRQGYSAELVTEFVKEWAWEQKEITKYDQITIAAEQIKRESRLLGKVDIIITDSPVLLSGFYESKFQEQPMVMSLLKAYKGETKREGHTDVHLIIPGLWKNYRTEGRYQTKEESEKFHQEILRYQALFGKPTGTITSVEEAVKALALILNRIQPTKAA